MQDNGFSEISSTCGFLFDDIQLLHGVNVHVKDHDCADPIERNVSVKPRNQSIRGMTSQSAE